MNKTDKIPNKLKKLFYNTEWYAQPNKTPKIKLIENKIKNNRNTIKLKKQIDTIPIAFISNSFTKEEVEKLIDSIVKCGTTNIGYSPCDKLPSLYDGHEVCKGFHVVLPMEEALRICDIDIRIEKQINTVYNRILELNIKNKKINILKNSYIKLLKLLKLECPAN